MNNSFACVRKRQILDFLDRCDSSHNREELLLDKIIKLEDTLRELQDSYTELLISYRKLSCVPNLF